MTICHKAASDEATVVDSTVFPTFTIQAHILEPLLSVAVAEPHIFRTATSRQIYSLLKYLFYYNMKCFFLPISVESLKEKGPYGTLDFVLYNQAIIQLFCHRFVC